jgi:hypothetical protein
MKTLRTILHWIFGIGMLATIIGGLAALVRQSNGLEAEPELGRRIGTLLFEAVGFYLTRKPKVA